MIDVNPAFRRLVYKIGLVFILLPYEKDSLKWETDFSFLISKWCVLKADKLLSAGGLRTLFRVFLVPYNLELLLILDSLDCDFYLNFLSAILDWYLF